MNAQVGVVIPMYDSASTICETLDSLCAQTMPAWRAVVIDDGSTDDGPSLVRGYMARDPRIIMHQQANRGLAGARNTGLAVLTEPYVAFLDADDWLEPDAFETLLPAAQASPWGAVYGRYQWRSNEGHDLGWASEITAPEAGLNELLEFNRFSVHVVMLARATLRGERFREHLRVVEDYDLWLRLAAHGVRFQGVPKIVAGYRVRPGSLSKHQRLMFETTRKVLQEAYDRQPTEANAARADRSMRRLQRVLESFALGHAATAACDRRDQTCAHAALILDQCPGLCLTPESMARAAYWSLPFGDCLPPSAWRTSAVGDLLAALERLCDRCVRDGRAEAGLFDAALAHLAPLVVESRCVAEHIAGQIPNGGRVVLLGCGANGRQLAPLLSTRGVRLRVHDDALTNGSTPIDDAEPISRADGPWPPDAVYVMTPEDDAGYLASLERVLPDNARVLRWSAARLTLAEVERTRLTHACSSVSVG